MEFMREKAMIPALPWETWFEVVFVVVLVLAVLKVNRRARLQSCGHCS
jgi:hypothetical protein